MNFINLAYYLKYHKTITSTTLTLMPCSVYVFYIIVLICKYKDVKIEFKQNHIKTDNRGKSFPNAPLKCGVILSAKGVEYIRWKNPKC